MVCSQEPYGNITITFKPNQIVLTRHFFNRGLVETSLFFKLPLEEEGNPEETCDGVHCLLGSWRPGTAAARAVQEQLRRIDEETTALVKELKEEWIGWQELPFFPPLAQFNPGYYLMVSSEFNWPAVGCLHLAAINCDDDRNVLDYDFLIAPKVKAVVFYLSKA